MQFISLFLILMGAHLSFAKISPLNAQTLGFESNIVSWSLSPSEKYLWAVTSIDGVGFQQSLRDIKSGEFVYKTTSSELEVPIFWAHNRFIILYSKSSSELKIFDFRKKKTVGTLTQVASVLHFIVDDERLTFDIMYRAQLTEGHTFRILSFHEPSKMSRISQLDSLWALRDRQDLKFMPGRKKDEFYIQLPDQEVPHYCHKAKLTKGSFNLSWKAAVLDHRGFCLIGVDESLIATWDPLDFKIQILTDAFRVQKTIHLDAKSRQMSSIKFVKNPFHGGWEFFAVTPNSDFSVWWLNFDRSTNFVDVGNLDVTDQQMGFTRDQRWSWILGCHEFLLVDRQSKLVTKYPLRERCDFGSRIGDLWARDTVVYQVSDRKLEWRSVAELVAQR